MVSIPDVIEIWKDIFPLYKFNVYSIFTDYISTLLLLYSIYGIYCIYYWILVSSNESQ